MATDPIAIQKDMLRQARMYMQSALNLLDQCDVSAHIGAYLDHALCELDSAIGVKDHASDEAAAGNSL